MDTLGYIFELSKGVISRGYTYEDLEFLDYILQGNTSKYKLKLKFQEEGRPISYKNIHRRVERLLQNRLIKEITVLGGYKHGARNFELTERGLPFLITEIGVPSQLPEFISTYKDTILFKTFVLNCFELRTIKNATYSLLRLLQNYLEECCLLVVSMLEGTTNAHSGMDISVSKLDDIGSIPDLQQLRLYLNWQSHSFLIKLCMLKDESNESTDWRNSMLNPPEFRFPTEGKIKCEANDKEETRYLISNDRKFMRVAKEIYEEFIQGYTKLNEAANKQAYK